ncbi:hypothetical protein PMIN04_002224 [Paraphaeosphaeria minitans]
MPMLGSPWMLMDQLSEATNMSMIFQTPAAFPPGPPPATSDLSRITFTLEDTGLPPISDVALYQAYKTVGMCAVDTRCFNCLKEKDMVHRRYWMRCGDSCPACPGDQQHWGGLCPRLCMLRKKKSFWMDRADLALADGFDGPTPGLSVTGWKRADRWREGRGGQKSPSGAFHLPSFSSVSAQSTVTSTPLTLTTASLVSSPATRCASTDTPVFKSAEAAITMAGKPTELAPTLKLPALSARISPTTSVDPLEVHHDAAQSILLSTPPSSGSRTFLTTRDRGRVAEVSRPENRTHSRSPSNGRNERIYRDGSAPQQAPVPAQVAAEKAPALPEKQPSLVSLLSDPIFKSVVSNEIVAMASANFSHHDPQQHAAIDGVLVAVLRAARIARRLESKDWEYQPSEPMKMYLGYIYKHFPVLMSQGTTGHFISKPSEKDPNPDIDTYYGWAWRGSRTQEEDQKMWCRLSELNRDLIEGRSVPRAQEGKTAGYKRHRDATNEDRTPRKIPRITFRDDPPQYNSSSPIAKTAAPAPRGPLAQDNKTWTLTRPRYIIPRGPTRYSWTSPKAPTSQIPVKVPPPAPKQKPIKVPPPLTIAGSGSEDGEVPELVKSTPGIPKDIMSCLEMQLSVEITAEDWGDLFKGDV